MCYSGKCVWEQSSGDCGFPTIKEVRNKFPLPLCEIDIENEEEANKFKLLCKKVNEIVKNNEN